MRLSNKWKVDENLQNLEKRRAIKSLKNFVFLTSNNVLCFNKDYCRQKNVRVLSCKFEIGNGRGWVPFSRTVC